MNKFLLTLGVAATAFAANAQQTYNYFDAADVDADGWLWLDSSAKISKYCAYNTTKATAKIQYIDGQYELADFTQPESNASATVKGWNAQGVKGGDGCKTGGILLPKSNASWIAGTTAADAGGGIYLSLPDCALLELYISSASPKQYAAVFGADGTKVRAADCSFIYSYDNGFEDWPIPDITYAGKWENIQNLNNSLLGQDVVLSIKGEPGQPKTVVIYNMVKSSDMIVHGIKLLTYTNSADNSAVTEIAAAVSDSDAPAYDTLGRQVDDTYRGLVIQNGKKIIRR